MMMGRIEIVTMMVAAFCAPRAVAFYLPGVAPKEYKQGDYVELKVNKLTSSKTQLAVEYYTMPFCQPDPIINAAENLGEILTGNMIENSPYDLYMRQDTVCNVLCRTEYTEQDAKTFVERIEEHYVVNWIVDNLPAATQVVLKSGGTTPVYEHGFNIGGTIVPFEGDTASKHPHYINNHARITIQWHKPDTGDDNNIVVGQRIVGFEVEPFSIRHAYSGNWDDANPPKLTSCTSLDDLRHDYNGVYEQIIDDGGEVIWTYDVLWEPSPIRWASRWDVYLSMNERYDDDVHWFSIVNSLLIVLFLTGMVAMIMLRTLHKDLARYNRVPTEEEKAEEREETGWKLVHGDVFRAPSWPMMFSVTVGTGIQTLLMAMITITFAAVGFLSPANRGSLLIALLLLFVVMGIFAGYNAARTYKMFNGKQWQRTTLLTAFFYPTTIFSVVFILNLVVWAEGSANAIPFGSLCAVLALWFGISVPLTFLGAYFGYKKDVDKQPVQTQDIPRQIPDQPWYMSPFLTVMVGGILPFGAVFVELFFILSSLWLDQYYYVFGFLLLVFVILIITCAEITIVLCYFQLCGEDYHWWWRSLVTSGSSAFYLFAYSAFYFFTKLDMTGFSAGALYFGYMTCLSILFFLATGVIGYRSCLWFVYKIYGSVKVD